MSVIESEPCQKLKVKCSKAGVQSTCSHISMLKLTICLYALDGSFSDRDCKYMHTTLLLDHGPRQGGPRSTSFLLWRNIYDHRIIIGLRLLKYSVKTKSMRGVAGGRVRFQKIRSKLRIENMFFSHFCGIGFDILVRLAGTFVGSENRQTLCLCIARFPLLVLLQAHLIRNQSLE